MQMGLLRPADCAHTRSQSNRICTLPELFGTPENLEKRNTSFARKHESTSSRYCRVLFLVVHHIAFRGLEPLAKQKNSSQEDSYNNTFASFSNQPQAGLVRRRDKTWPKQTIQIQYFDVFCPVFMKEIGRADIDGSKNNVAMNAWLPQISYPGGKFSDTSS